MTTITRTGTGQRISAHVDNGVVRLYVLDCPNCGVVFGINTDYEDRRRKDGASFHCPNGHPQSWYETEAIKLAKKLESAETERQYWIGRQRETADRFLDEKRAHSATKGQLTKTRKRAVAGTCPCCSRSFVDVRRHMASKHPDEAVRGLGDGAAKVKSVASE